MDPSHAGRLCFAGRSSAPLGQIPFVGCGRRRGDQHGRVPARESEPKPEHRRTPAPAWGVPLPAPQHAASALAAWGLGGPWDWKGGTRPARVPDEPVVTRGRCCPGLSERGLLAPKRIIPAAPSGRVELCSPPPASANRRRLALGPAPWGGCRAVAWQRRGLRRPEELSWERMSSTAHPTGSQGSASEGLRAPQAPPPDSSSGSTEPMRSRGATPAAFSS